MNIQRIDTDWGERFYDIDKTPYWFVCSTHGSANRLWAYITGPSQNEHRIQLRDDGWTIVHPPVEHLTGKLLDCDWAVWPFEDDGRRGVYTLIRNDDDTLVVGDKVSE